MMQTPKHLPYREWPEADRLLFEAAFTPRDMFDEEPPNGGRLAAGTRKIVRTCYSRWLGFICREDGSLLGQHPAERITPSRVKRFVELLIDEVRLTTASTYVLNLNYAIRLMVPMGDWLWISAIGYRLADRAEAIDRLPELVTPFLTLDFGIRLMDTTAAHKHRRAQENQYRDGLLLALLSVWPMRRRSVAALTTDHVRVTPEGFDIFLRAEDTKEKRTESAPMPAELVPYLRDYIRRVRPAMVGNTYHDGLWPSRKGGALSDARLYSIIRNAILKEFGKRMGLHDMRRAAATFIGIDDPEQVGLIPGVLSHADPRVSQAHYNLANSAAASRRYNATLEDVKKQLRP